MLKVIICALCSADPGTINSSRKGQCLPLFSFAGSVNTYHIRYKNLFWANDDFQANTEALGQIKWL